MKILCLTPIKHLDGIYEHLERYGRVYYSPDLNKEDFTYFDMDEYDVIFCNPNKQKYVLDKDTLGVFRGTILTASTGLNHIDIKYCKEVGIKVLSHKEDMELLNQLPSTAELAFTLMSSMVRNIPSSFDDVKNGGWDYDKFMGHQLQGKSVGIIGYGRLGKMMNKYCWVFGMRVIAYDPYVFEDGYDLDYVLENSDIISLHVHVTDETRHMINKKTLGKMKKNSYIVNTSRGEIVNEKDVIKSLEDGHLKGYATDVVDDEFGNIKNSELIKRTEDLNIIVTPHIGGMTKEAQEIAYNGVINKFKEKIND